MQQRIRVCLRRFKAGRRTGAGQAAIDAFFTTRGNDLYVILPRWPGPSFVLKDVSG
jgi:hypothetical protein